MSRAEVRPEKWRETVNVKLGTAQQHWYELYQSEVPEWNRYHEPHDYARQLVGAARGVYQVTETLVGNPRSWPWYTAWLDARLTPDERSLWHTMREVRVAEEHGEGADLIGHPVPITRGEGSHQIFTNYAIMQIPPDQRPQGPSKFTVRFPAYPDRPASEVARAYIEICNRFADDFERDHPHLFGAKKL